MSARMSMGRPVPIICLLLESPSWNDARWCGPACCQLGPISRQACVADVSAQSPSYQQSVLGTFHMETFDVLEFRLSLLLIFKQRVRRLETH